MEIRKALENILSSIEDEETRRQELLAFRDFCRDLQEEFGMPKPDKEPNAESVKRLLVHR